MSHSDNTFRLFYNANLDCVSKYGANERSQKLKYHIQTSGRSLHAQEISFNDIKEIIKRAKIIKNIRKYLL